MIAQETEKGARKIKHSYPASSGFRATDFLHYSTKTP